MVSLSRETSYLKWLMGLEVYLACSGALCQRNAVLLHGLRTMVLNP